MAWLWIVMTLWMGLWARGLDAVRWLTAPRREYPAVHPVGGEAWRLSPRSAVWMHVCHVVLGSELPPQVYGVAPAVRTDFATAPPTGCGHGWAGLLPATD